MRGINPMSGTLRSRDFNSISVLTAGLSSSLANTQKIERPKATELEKGMNNFRLGLMGFSGTLATSRTVNRSAFCFCLAAPNSEESFVPETCCCRLLMFH